MVTQASNIRILLKYELMPEKTGTSLKILDRRGSTYNDIVSRHLVFMSLLISIQTRDLPR